MSGYTKLAVILGMCYAGYKYGPGSVAKTASVAIGAVVVAKQVPFLSDTI